ncbi:MAG TPA: hypothetical protein VF648_09545 [Pyrinomonadaceae bacterium]
MKTRLIYILALILVLWLTVSMSKAQTNPETSQQAEINALKKAIQAEEAKIEAETDSFKLDLLKRNQKLRYTNLINRLNQRLSTLKEGDQELKPTKDLVEVLNERLKLFYGADSVTITTQGKPETTVIKPENVVSKPTLPSTAVPTKPVDVSKVDSKSNSFTDAPAIIKDDAQILAKSILYEVKKRNPNALSRIRERYPQLFFLTLASTVDTGQSINSIAGLAPIRFLIDTARTDKQIGASSSTSASTSTVEKPSFPWLLGLALENGALEKNVQDTVLTLNTSPAALFSFTERDTAVAYRNAGVFNKIGVSASFNINNQNALLANATRSQLREYSIRYRFYGDRSSRSPKLQEIWDTKIAPLIIGLLAPLGRGVDIIDRNDFLRVELDSETPKLQGLIDSRMQSADFKTLKEDEQANELTNITLNFLKTFITDRVKSKEIVIADDVKSEINEVIKDIGNAQQNQKAAEKLIEKQLDEFFKSPLGTVAYTNHRDILGNFSEFKAIYDQPNVGFLRPFTNFTANAGFSFYHKPNSMLNQKKTRDFNVAIAFEGKRTNPFQFEGDLSQITYSFNLRYARLLENQNLANRKADLFNTQFLLNIPLFNGIFLPFSVTYSNATELERKQGFRVNFGLKFDSDKLFDLSRYNQIFK